MTALLNSVLWSYNIFPKTKQLIYNAIEQSTLQYGAETRTLNLCLKRKLLCTEMDLWRRSARESMLEKIKI